MVAMGVEGPNGSVTWNLNMTNETVASRRPFRGWWTLTSVILETTPCLTPMAMALWTLTLEVESGYTGYYTFHQRRMRRLVLQGEHRRPRLRQSRQLQ